MIAPIIGGWIIESASWRWIFILQALLGLISALGVWSMKESLTELNTESLSQVFRSYLRLMSNRPFFMLPLALACLGIPFFAFIAVSAEIYISGLGYSENNHVTFHNSSLV